MYDEYKIYETEHVELVGKALSRLHLDLETILPLTGTVIWDWIISQHPVEGWTHPRGFPFFLIPWWVERDICGSNDIPFQTDLIYASIAAYSHIRMVDNVMDGHAEREYQIIGATGVFHTLFHAVYQQYFANDNPFWTLFREAYCAGVDCTIQDGLYTDKTEARFNNVISRKTGFARIPLAAVCYRYNRPDLIAPWSRFIDLFSRWHLMEEDVFDYLTDIKNATPTFFLCEANRRKKADERTEAWVIREGLDWAFGLMGSWLEEIRAGDITPAARAYVDAREALQLKQREKVAPGLEALAKLLSR